MKNTVLPIGSIVHWDKSERKPCGGKRHFREFTPITCGKCGKIRLWRRDMIRKKIRTGCFTGCCKLCFVKLTWKEKHRNRPEKRKTTQHGYVKIFIGIHHPMADMRGEIYEHRLVMCKKLKRPLEKWEHVHHKDGNRANNSIENLELYPKSDHGTVNHMKERIKYLENLLNKHNISY